MKKNRKSKQGIKSMNNAPKKLTRTKKNEHLYESQLRELENTIQQKFNFEENYVEDELDVSFLERKKKKKPAVIEKKVYPVKLLVCLIGILILSMTFITVHYITFNHNQEKIVTKTIKKEVLSENILFLGDSITDYYDVKKYYPDHHVVNSGIAGNKTFDILEDMEGRVYQYNPSKIFLLIGTNDLEEKRGIDKTFENIKKIIKGIKENRGQAEIYIEAIYPVNKQLDENMVHNRENDSIRTINKLLKKYCKEMKLTYIDTYALLQGEEGNLKEEYSDDGLHLNENGYEHLTKKLETYLD